MKPAFTVGIPWRSSPSRERPYEKVRAFWDEFFPDIPVVTADSDSDIFSLSQARNNAVTLADTPIVCLCDADTVPPVDSVNTAVQMALTGPPAICWPHKVWRLIPPEYAERPFEEFPDAPTLVEHPEGLGGCMVTTTDEYWRLGGSPPEFYGWGH